MSDQTGTELAGYRIESLIGRGGMSVVYLAEQEFPRRKVALKVLAPELTEDQRFRERFIRESNTAAAIDHPNIIPIYGAGEVDGRLYIAMRYVKGMDLKALVKAEGRLDPARAVSIVTQVANALDAAHAEGLVHRDVKPGNILLVSGPESLEHVYLSDFGLTKRASSDSGITGTGQFVGTLDYAAPEQFEGRPLDGRTDVYSLGCVAFECLTGEIPFQRDQDAALMYAHLMSPRPKPTATRPELPPAVDQVIGRAMSKRPENRHPSAGQFAADLAGALGVAGAGRVAAPMSVVRRRRRTGLLVGAALVVAIGTVAVILTLTRGGGGPSGPTAAGLQITSNTLVQIDPKTNRPVAVVRVGRKPDLPTAVGDGNLWVLNTLDSTVSVVDIRTNEVVETFGGNTLGGIGMAWGFGSAWVTSGEHVLSRINASTHLVESTFAFDSIPDLVATGDGMVWATTHDGTAAWIDPLRNKVVKTVSLPFQTAIGRIPSAVAIGEGSVWVTGYNDGAVWRIDPKTGQVTTIDAGGNPSRVAVGFGSVWVTNPGTGSIQKISPATGEVVDIPVEKLATSVAGLTTGANSVWVANTSGRAVLRIDPISNEVTTIRIAGQPLGITVTEQAVWVTIAAAGGSRTG